MRASTLKTNRNRYLQTIDIAEISAGLLDTLNECLLTLTHPNTGIVVLIQRCQRVNPTTTMTRKSYFLVGFVGTLGIAYLC